MLKLFPSSVAVLAGIVSAPVVFAPLHVMTKTPSGYREDSRGRALRTFFDRMHCPARKYIAEFLDAADGYRLDWRLLPSLAFVESGGGKAAPNNNLFGWDSGRAQFSSPIAGIHEVGYRLAHSPLYKDKDLDALLATYNPDAEYARKVKFVMEQISPAE